VWDWQPAHSSMVYYFPEQGRSPAFRNDSGSEASPYLELSGKVLPHGECCRSILTGAQSEMVLAAPLDALAATLASSVLWS
jgi:hypothetical protein